MVMKIGIIKGCLIVLLQCPQKIHNFFYPVPEFVVYVPSQLVPKLRNYNATDDSKVDFRSFRKILRSRLGKLM